jgi:hypothetical protein
MGPAETLTLPLGGGWVLCRPDMDRLVVLNATGKTVWDLLGGGFGQQEIASAFAQHFGLPAEAASADVRKIIGGLEEAGCLPDSQAKPAQRGAPQAPPQAARRFRMCIAGRSNSAIAASGCTPAYRTLAAPIFRVSSTGP